MPHRVKVDNNKITVIVEWPHPTNISKLCGFLGLTRYYKKFVKDYGIIARPVTSQFFVLEKTKNRDIETLAIRVKCLIDG